MTSMLQTRRRFLKSATAIATGAWVAPRFAIGQSGPSANRKINLAFIGGRVEYDAAQMKITNRPELNAFLLIPARDGWKYGELL